VTSPFKHPSLPTPLPSVISSFPMLASQLLSSSLTTSHQLSPTILHLRSSVLTLSSHLALGLSHDPISLYQFRPSPKLFDLSIPPRVLFQTAPYLSSPLHHSVPLPTTASRPLSPSSITYNTDIAILLPTTYRLVIRPRRQRISPPIPAAEY